MAIHAPSLYREQLLALLEDCDPGVQVAACGKLPGEAKILGARMDFDPGHNAFLKRGDFLLALFQRDSPNTALANDYLARTGGPRGDVYHAAFRIDPVGLDALAADLRGAGVSVKGPVEFPSKRRSYFIEDPDQHYLELTDR